MTRDPARDRAFLARHRQLEAEDDRPARGSIERVQVFGEMRRESKAAWLIFDGTREAWVPKSQVKITEAAGGAVEIDMPEWLAKKKGFI